MPDNYCAKELLASYINIADLGIPVDWSRQFGREAPLEVEIGFGTGEYILELARDARDKNFLGLEQCPERIVKTLRKIGQSGLANVKLVQVDAVLAFNYLISPRSVQKVHCLFPCPWPKKRHAKHRLFSADFLRIVNNRLVPGGQLRIVTDHHPYADWIMENLSGSGLAAERRLIPPQFGTKFEKKWLAAGQQVFDELVLSKVAEINRADPGVVEMKTFFLEKIDPAKVDFAQLSGPLSVQFKDFMFDTGRDKGMVQAIVTENHQTQCLWITIHRTAKGWCLRAAPGSSVLPTEGVHQALDMARSAFGASGIKS